MKQSESASGRDKTKIYVGDDKGIYTLSQKYIEHKDKDGVVTKAGWQNYLSQSFDFAKFEKETADLVRSIYKAKGQLALGKSKGLVDDHLFEPQANLNNARKQLRENIELARALDQDKSNDFSLRNFMTSIREGTKEARNKYTNDSVIALDNQQKLDIQNATAPYEEATKKAQELDKINKSILSTQKKLDATQNESDKTQLSSDLRDAKQRKKELESDLTTFRNNQQKQFGPYRSKEFSDALEKSNNAFEQVMRQANASNSDIGNYEQSKIDKENLSQFNAKYDAAIAKVKELKDAQIDLANIQNEYKINPSDEIEQKFENAKKKVSDLKKETEAFHEEYTSSDNFLNPKKAEAYAKAYESAQQSETKYNKNLVSDMQEQYNLQMKAEQDLIKLSGSKQYSQNEHMLLAASQARAKQSYENMYKEVSAIYGEDYAKSQISGISDKYDVSKNKAINSNFDSISKEINSYVSKIQNANRASEGFNSAFSSISEGLTSTTEGFKNGTISLNDYVSHMTELRESLDQNKDFYENGAGKDELDYTEQMNKLNKYTNSGNKIAAYGQKIQEFSDRYNAAVTQLGEDNDKSKFHDSVTEIISDIEKFQKTASGYEKENGKGILQEGTLGTIKDIDDATSALRNYASQLGLTNEVSTSINKSTGSISLGFKDASGNLVTLTGNIEKANDSLRIMEKFTNKAGTSGFTSLTDSLKGLVKGNFSSALGDVADAVGSIQIMQQAWQQMQKGFSTFMDYDKALTTISYTMDMNKQQLSDLGTSSVDMAKDLLMSLDNTMDIYQIYANMNTTSKEIQETAKPTAILSNLSGVDASTAADQVQGILQQFHMLEDGSTSAADASMHVVDVMDKISSNVGMDYAKGIKVMSDAVQASGQVAYDAGMSYEQLAAISAKVAERTREDGSSIGNAIKTNNCLYVQKCA